MKIRLMSRSLRPARFCNFGVRFSCYWWVMQSFATGTMIVFIRPPDAEHRVAAGFRAIKFVYPYPVRNTGWLLPLDTFGAFDVDGFPGLMRQSWYMEFHLAARSVRWGSHNGRHYSVDSQWKPASYAQFRGALSTYIPDVEMNDFCLEVVEHLCWQLCDPDQQMGRAT